MLRNDCREAYDNVSFVLFCLLKGVCDGLALAAGNTLDLITASRLKNKTVDVTSFMEKANPYLYPFFYTVDEACQTKNYWADDEEHFFHLIQHTNSAPYTNQGFAGLARAVTAVIAAVPIAVAVPIGALILTPFVLFAEKLCCTSKSSPDSPYLYL